MHIATLQEYSSLQNARETESRTGRLILELTEWLLYQSAILLVCLGHIFSFVMSRHEALGAPLGN